MVRDAGRLVCPDWSCSACPLPGPVGPQDIALLQVTAPRVMPAAPTMPYAAEVNRRQRAAAAAKQADARERQLRLQAVTLSKGQR